MLDIGQGLGEETDFQYACGLWSLQEVSKTQSLQVGPRFVHALIGCVHASRLENEVCHR